MRSSACRMARLGRGLILLDYNERKRTSIMARLFNSYVIVDWSAASKPVEGADSIWIGALAPNARNQLVFKSSKKHYRNLFLGSAQPLH